MHAKAGTCAARVHQAGKVVVCIEQPWGCWCWVMLTTVSFLQAHHPAKQPISAAGCESMRCWGSTRDQRYTRRWSIAHSLLCTPHTVQHLHAAHVSTAWMIHVTYSHAQQPYLLCLQELFCMHAQILLLPSLSCACSSPTCSLRYHQLQPQKEPPTPAAAGAPQHMAYPQMVMMRLHSSSSSTSTSCCSNTSTSSSVQHTGSRSSRSSGTATQNR